MNGSGTTRVMQNMCLWFVLRQEYEERNTKETKVDNRTALLKQK